MNLNLLFIVISCLSLCGVFVVGYLYWRQQVFFKNFTKDISKDDLKSALKHLNRQLELLHQQQAQASNQIQQLQLAVKSHFQKSGFVRFNPYSDTGGDQSFCFCLLDDYNNGIVITSLHSREQTRLYAKKINQGVVEGNILSKEEELTLKQALQTQTRK